ncbi:MAG: hypothetical protein LBJ00_04590 [Planctomycetaceae bacterium]|jgi:hypothetical protein|nr:hypothetical protein [Planctomycetaceae bacterium]
MKISNFCWILVVCFSFTNVSFAQTINPVMATMDVLFKDGGNDQCVTVLLDGLWLPANSGWDNRNTKAGSKIEHVDTTCSFPLNQGGFTITADKVNAYWDAQYLSATRIGEPGWASNCYGYSTGLGYWVQKNGYSVVLSDDWQQCTQMADVSEGCTRNDGDDHSIKITKVAPANENMYRVVWETIEKQAYAGTYKKVYSLPGGANIGYNGTYRPK